MEFISTNSYLIKKGYKVDTIKSPFTYSSIIDDHFSESKKFQTPYFNINSRKRRGLDIFLLNKDLFLETRPPVYGMDGCIRIPHTKNYNLFHRKFKIEKGEFIFNKDLPSIKVKKDLILIGEVEDGDSYGHFTQQIIPLIKIMQERYESKKILLPYEKHSWYEELLDFFEIDILRLRFLKIPKEVHVRANNTLYCEMLDLVSGYFTAHKFCQEKKNVDSCGNKLIYFKRSKFSRTENDKEIADLIEHEGGLVIDPLKLSILEANRILRNAECIVVEFGASLTNLIHCREGTKVIVLMPEAIMKPELNKKAEVFVNATYEGLMPILLKFDVIIVEGTFGQLNSKYSWESAVTMSGDKRIKCFYDLDKVRQALKN